MMDDNTGDLETLKIDRQIRELHGKLDRIQNSQNVGGGMSWKDVLHPLLVAAVCSLIGAVWVLSRSVAVLQASDDYQWDVLKEHSSDIKVLQGRGLRGHDEDEEPARGQ